MAQAAAFKEKKNAERYVKELRSRGNYAYMERHRSGKEYVYRVFSEVKKEESKGQLTAAAGSAVVPESRAVIGEGKPALRKEPVFLAQATPSETLGSPAAEKVTQEKTAPEKSTPETVPPRVEPIAVTAAVGSAVVAAAESNESPEAELSRFESREEAEKFVQKMKINGFDTVIRDETSGDRTVYRVLLQVQEGKSGLVKADEPTPASSHLPEKKGGYVHGSLSLLGVYTDNAYNSKDHKESDFSLMLEPEVWVAVPPVNQNPQAGAEPIFVRSPGGYALSEDRKEIFRRYQTVFSYAASIPLSSTNSPSGNTTTHNVMGTFIYNAPGGLSLDLEGEYIKSFEVNAPLYPQLKYEPDIYSGTRLLARAQYDTAHRIRVAFEYSYFLLDFDEPRNEYRNRTDNVFSGYVFYKLFPKTSVFAEYDYVDISYDSNSKLDSTEQHIYGGIYWDMTAKSKGSIKAGYGTKDFSSPDSKEENFIFEAQIDHKLTAKTSLVFLAFSRTDETNMFSKSYILSQGMGIKYNQLLTAKILGLAAFYYTKDKFRDDIYDGFETADREDDVYQMTAELQHEFRRYLRSNIGYTFVKRDSSLPGYSFSSNTFFFRITGAF